MSLVIGIRYLFGRSVATHVANREDSEWPPHPDRVFSALAAAFFETGQDPIEKEALRWLECQPAPSVICSRSQFLEPVTVYVPVNDTATPRLRSGRALSKAQEMQLLSLVPQYRQRQPRTFPTSFPFFDTVYVKWSNTPSKEHLHALRALCSKVTYLGHSSSLVQMWLKSDTAALIDDASDHAFLIHLKPESSGIAQFRLRVPHEGRLDQLEQSYLLKLRPPFTAAIGYRTEDGLAPSKPSIGSYFSPELIVLRQIGGRRFGLESTQLLTHHLRRTIMSARPIKPLPEWLSGHTADGAASQRKCGHLALIPLPHVGSPHADGHLLGMALVVPEDIPTQEIGDCLNALLFDAQGWPKDVQLTLGSLGKCTLRLDDQVEFRTSLDPRVWTRPAERWATVTPVCLDRHPKENGTSYWRQVEDQIAAACQRIGLPRPHKVIATPSPLFTGVRHAHSMPKLVRKNDGGTIQHIHAVLEFDEPVRGPVLLGAGRYRGYGLCRPF